MKNKWKIDEHERAEVVGIIKGHRARAAKYKGYAGVKTLFDVQETRKVYAVDKALEEATEDIQDEYERKKVKQYLILGIENCRKYPYIRFDTVLSEYQYFQIMYKFIFLTSENLKK